jgi:hypothetical protein
MHMQTHCMHTGRRGQKMLRAVAAGINAPLCAPNIQLIVQILTGCIINSDLHFAGAGPRREKVQHYAAHLPLRLWCRCSACTAAIFSLSLLRDVSFAALVLGARGNIIRTRVFRSTGYYIARRGKLLCSGFADGWSAACLLARARKSLINDSL